MKTSKQWLSEVKLETSKMSKWLVRQYFAEKEAAVRIQELTKVSENRHQKILTKIANDEEYHAELLLNLCKTRNLDVCDSSNTESRYYNSVKVSDLSVDEMYAAGAFAEGMRLARIKAIVEDKELDEDIRSAFGIILKDEIMHEKVFDKIASKDAKSKVKSMHNAGVVALGLVI